jgi:hypothetical protein
MLPVESMTTSATAGLHRSQPPRGDFGFKPIERRHEGANVAVRLVVAEERKTIEEMSGHG